MEFSAQVAEIVIVLAQERDFLLPPLMAGRSHTQMRKGME
jgi:hypothetical protein